MSGDLPFTCKCGSVAGVIRRPGPEAGDRLVCHCDNCRQFAHFCGAQNHVLDAHGGTDLYQSRCTRVEIRQGREDLACVHLTDKPTLRWYAGCCRSPLFNTYANGRLPYITTLLANCEANASDSLLGRPRGHFFLKDAPESARGLPAGSVASSLLRCGLRIAKDTVSGDRRRSALFDPETLEPIATPHRLDKAERRQLVHLARAQ